MNKEQHKGPKYSLVNYPWGLRYHAIISSRSLLGARRCGCPLCSSVVKSLPLQPKARHLVKVCTRAFLRSYSILSCFYSPVAFVWGGIEGGGSSKINNTPLT